MTHSVHDGELCGLIGHDSSYNGFGINKETKQCTNNWLELCLGLRL